MSARVWPVQALSFALCALALVACSSESRLVDSWIEESATQSYACSVALRADKSYSQNCNGRNVQRGTWEMNGDTLRFLGERGGTIPCTMRFDGSVLVLDGDECRYRNRYEQFSVWSARQSR